MIFIDKYGKGGGWNQGGQGGYNSGGNWSNDNFGGGYQQGYGGGPVRNNFNSGGRSAPYGANSGPSGRQSGDSRWLPPFGGQGCSSFSKVKNSTVFSLLFLIFISLPLHFF